MSQMFSMEEGWLTPCQYAFSPNFNERPTGISPSLAVIHHISLPPNQFGGSEIVELFQNKLDFTAHPYFEKIAGIKVSAHFLIRRDGALIQFVSCAQRAWHAGKSSFFSRENCNDFSIGIELEGSDFQAFTTPQYQKLSQLLVFLFQHYDLSACVGHSDIAPGRKTDPGVYFDWHHLIHLSSLSPHYFPFCR